MKIVLAVSMVSFGLALPPALGDPVVLTFEGLPHRTSIFAQFEDKGVSFNGPQIMDYSLVVPSIPNFAHSGTKGIEQCFAIEFCTSPVEMTFTAPQRRVKASIGVSFDMVVPFTVVLTGFDAGGGQVARASIDFTTPGIKAVQTPLEAVAPTASIVRAAISTLVEGQPGGTSGVAIDDIEFDTQGPPPVCTATEKAFVGLVNPKNDTVTQIDSFLLQGLVVSDALLHEATLTMVGPDGTSRIGDMLSSGVVQRDDGPFGPIRCSALVPGSNTIRVAVKNCLGGESEEATVIYTPIPAGMKFVLDRIQFLQAIQDPSNLVPLIARKRTVARVFLHLQPPAGGGLDRLFDVSATMTATNSAGNQMPGPPRIGSLNKVVLASTPDPADLFKLDKTLNFELPPEWIQEGTVHVRLEKFLVEGQQVFFPCINCDVPFQFGVARFEAAPPLRLVLFDVPWSTDGGATVHSTGTTHFDHLESWLRRAYPTDDVQVTRGGSLARIDGLPDSDFDCNDVNARLAQRIAMCACAPQTHFYGLVNDSTFMRGCSSGIPTRTASGPAGSSSFGWDNDGSYADWYGGHELGHTYGRKHPGFCGESDDDDDYPYSSGRIGTIHAGFDIGDSSLGIPMAINSPGIFGDVMTYCDFQWISDYTYKGILARLRAIEASPGGGGGGAAQEMLMVQGKIDLVTGEVTLRQFLRLEGLTATAAPESSPYAIDLRDVGGATLALHAFEVAPHTDPDPTRNLIGTFNVVVPWEVGATTIVILKDGLAIASRKASARAPQVHLDGVNLLPGNRFLRVSWTAADADRDRITYALQYTNDEGRTWIPIDTELTTDSIDISVLRLPGGAKCAFRIIASDGLNTSIDDQDATMAIPDRSPRARILNPESGFQVPSGEPLLLRGDASDLEDGALRGADLVWGSESAKSLGTGTALSVSNLPPGLHTISLTARDSAGNTDSASIDVEVLPEVVAALADVTSLVPLGGTAFLDGSESSGQGTLKFKWSLLSKPAGSAAEVALADAAVANLTPDAAGTYLLQLRVEDAAGQVAVALPEVEAIAAVKFRRGDVNSDDYTDISDPVAILGYLFLGENKVPCEQAGDANDDGVLDISDGVYILSFLFLGGKPIEPPVGTCGVDPTGHDLPCRSFPGCP